MLTDAVKGEAGRQAEIGDRQRSRGQQGGGEARTSATAERPEETGRSGFTRLDFQAIFGGCPPGALQSPLTTRQGERTEIRCRVSLTRRDGWEETADRSGSGLRYSSGS